MALPKLLQKLFQNNGAGDKLNQDIIPDIPYSKITDAPSVDSALSSTSENPVQNKVVNSALDGKLSTSGGTMTGVLKIHSDAGTLRLQTFGATGSTTTNSGAHVATLENDSYLQVHPSNPGEGAALFLSSSSYSGAAMDPGCFYLISRSPDKATAYWLVGSYAGNLSWRGHNVLTVVAESYSANSWYRKYSDGWIEQGGQITAAGYQKVAITLSVPFSNTNYTILIGESTNYLGYGAQNCTVFKETVKTTGFTLEQNDNNSGGSWWMACGK